MGATTRGRRESDRNRGAPAVTATGEFRSIGSGAEGTPALLPSAATGRYGGPPVDLDLLHTLRSTGAARQFHPEPVGDDVLARLLDTARFAPSGGNRQGWRVIVVKDPTTRVALRDLYLRGWYEYLAMGSAGLVPWAPVTDRAAEAAAIANAGPFADAGAAAPGFAETLETAPALLLVLADLTALAAVDRDLPRYTFAGGASIYPFVWSLLLAARTEGLGGVMTTMPVRAGGRGAGAVRHSRHGGGGRPRRPGPPDGGPAPPAPRPGAVLRLGRPLRGRPARCALTPVA